MNTSLSVFIATAVFLFASCRLAVAFGGESYPSACDVALREGQSNVTDRRPGSAGQPVKDADDWTEAQNLRAEAAHLGDRRPGSAGQPVEDADDWTGAQNLRAEAAHLGDRRPGSAGQPVEDADDWTGAQNLRAEAAPLGAGRPGSAGQPVEDADDWTGAQNLRAEAAPLGAGNGQRWGGCEVRAREYGDIPASAAEGHVQQADEKDANGKQSSTQGAASGQTGLQGRVELLKQQGRLDEGDAAQTGNAVQGGLTDSVQDGRLTGRASLSTLSLSDWQKLDLKVFASKPRPLPAIPASTRLTLAQARVDNRTLQAAADRLASGALFAGIGETKAGEHTGIKRVRFHLVRCPPADPQRRWEWKIFEQEIFNPEMGKAWREWEEAMQARLTELWEKTGTGPGGVSYHIILGRDLRVRELVQRGGYASSQLDQAAQQVLSQLLSYGAIPFPRGSGTQQVHITVTFASPGQ